MIEALRAQILLTLNQWAEGHEITENTINKLILLIRTFDKERPKDDDQVNTTK